MSALRAAVVFLCGLLAGADLLWWFTHSHCKWSPWDCVHFWHHVLFFTLYVGAAVLAWKGGDAECGDS